MGNQIEISGFVAPGFEAVRDAFLANFESGDEVGASFAAVHKGRSVVDLWAGHQDRDRTRVWKEDTIVNVYSTTKGMGSIALAALFDEGKLDYEARITDYWPEFGAHGKGELSVAQVLSHQAGVCGPREPIEVEDLYDWDKMCAMLAAQEPFWAPGTKSGYHAITWGYLAGEVIRRVTGKSMGAYFHEKIAGPLKADFYIGLPEAEEGRASDMLSAAPMSPEQAAKMDPKAIQAGLEMQKSELYQAALGNPQIKPFTHVSSRAWRAAEIPAANGTANARGIARIYGALANGGEIDGIRVLSEGAIDESTKQEWGDEPDAVLGMPMPKARGFMLNRMGMYGPDEDAFGHSGAGGSIGFADRTAGVGIGYAMNQMANNLDGDSRGGRLIKAVYAAL